MDKMVVKGGLKLNGEVNVSAAKNSVLPIIVACTLCRDKCIIENIPILDDVLVICELLRRINVKVDLNIEEKLLVIDSTEMKNNEIDEDLVRKMRASFLIIGPLLATFGKVKISMPGGCNIGTRPIDLHLKGFTALNAQIEFEHGFVQAKTNKLYGNKIYLDFPSVGATENIMMAATLAEGETIIENAAAEPEIQDLANFLNKMGAIISGVGTGTIRIFGVPSLHGAIHKPIYDRIEAGTFMIAAAMTKSKIKINNIEENHLRPVISKLKECGVDIVVCGKSIIVDGERDLYPSDIKTMPYPGFPTDMQSQMMSFLSTVQGTSLITETIFENRFMFISELKRMGANIKIDGRCAILEGVERLTGAEVKATDLRAGASLILAGLIAEGETKISDIYHITRGYDSIESKFKDLGADITIINE